MNIFMVGKKGLFSDTSDLEYACYMLNTKKPTYLVVQQL